MSRWQKIGKYVTIKNYTVYFSAKADNGLLAGEVYGKRTKSYLVLWQSFTTGITK